MQYFNIALYAPAEVAGARRHTKTFARTTSGGSDLRAGEVRPSSFQILLSLLRVRLGGQVQRERTLQVLIPEDVQPSVLYPLETTALQNLSDSRQVEGIHVKNRYFLDVEVDAGTCTCNITCQIPVYVYTPQPGTLITFGAGRGLP